MIIITTALLKRVNAIVVLNSTYAIDWTMISRICDYLKIITRVTLKLNATTFLCIGHIFFFNSSIIVYNTNVCLVDFIKTRDIYLLCFF